MQGPWLTREGPTVEEVQIIGVELAVTPPDGRREVELGAELVRRKRPPGPFLAAVCFPHEVYAQVGERDYVMVRAEMTDVSRPPALELYEPGQLDYAIARARELAGRQDYREVVVEDSLRTRLAWFGALWVRELYPGSELRPQAWWAGRLPSASAVLADLRSLWRRRSNPELKA